MADLILGKKTKKIEKIRISLAALHIKDYSTLSQLQDEFKELSALPAHIVDMITKNKNNPRVQCMYQDFKNKCFTTRVMFARFLFKIHRENYSTHYNSDFNYLYNDSENRNGIELYIYDLKTHKRTSTLKLHNCRKNHSLLDQIAGIIKIANSHLFIIGNNHKGYLMELKNKEINLWLDFNYDDFRFDKSRHFVYYDNCIYIFFGAGLMKYDLNRQKLKNISFPSLMGRVFTVIYHKYILVTSFWSSKFYLYDFTIESCSEITFLEDMKGRKFLFTDQKRVYLLMENNSIYESSLNNPFKWKIIGNLNFGTHGSPNNITFSNFEGDIYASFIEKPEMYCYKFNKKRIEMELIYQGEVSY